MPVYPTNSIYRTLSFTVTIQLSVHLNVAIFALKDMQRVPEAIQYIEKASMMYVENGTPDTAAIALDRAGK